MKAKVFSAHSTAIVEFEDKLNRWLEREPNVVVHCVTAAGGGAEFPSDRFCMLIVFYTDEVTE